MFPRRTLVFLIAASAFAAAPDGAALYKSRCGACHDGAPQPRMPKREEIAARTPEFVFNAMSGVMGIQAAGLSEDEERAIARYVTAKDFGPATSNVMSGQCTAPAPKFSIGDDDWNGWGVDPGNSRYQPKPGLSAADVADHRPDHAHELARARPVRALHDRLGG